MKTKSIVLFLMALLIVIAACSPSSSEPNNQQKTFAFEVTDAEGNMTSHVINTSEATVGAALLEAGLIEGEDSDFGLMVIYVDGIRADFAEDGAYWAFHIDGEFAMAGVDSTNIEEGVTYAFVYTPA